MDMDMDEEANSHDLSSGEVARTSAAEISRLLDAVARPFVIATDRELSVLRRGLTKNGWKRSLYLRDPEPNQITLTGQGLLGTANHWLASKTTIAELEDTRGESAHIGLAAGCLALSLVYQIDRDAECADKSAEILRGCAKACVGKPTDGAAREPIAEAAWLIALAQAYDLVCHSKALSGQDRLAIENDLLRGVADRLLSLQTGGAKAAYCSAAAVVAGCAVKDPRMVSSGLARALGLLESALGDDGLWSDPLHSSHFVAIEAFVHIAEACARAGLDLYDRRSDFGSKLARMFVAPVSYTYPSFQIPAMDGDRFHSTLPFSLYEVAYRRWNDPLFAWVLKTGYGIGLNPSSPELEENRSLYTRGSLYAFLFGRDLPGRVHEPHFSSSDYPTRGVCVLRDESQTLLTFDHGSTDSDRHRDQLGITLYSRGRLQIPDYGSSSGLDTAVHSTILVDGTSQQPSREVKLTEFSPGIYIQCASASTDANLGVRHDRQVATLSTAVIVQDRVESDSSHVYDWLMHCSGKLMAPAENSSPSEPCSPHLGCANLLATATDSQQMWDACGAGLAGWFAMDEAGEIIGSDCASSGIVPPPPVLDLRRTGQTAGYLAVLVPFSDATPTIERAGKTFKITIGEVTEWIHIADAPGAPGGNPEMESDARFAAVREVNGTVEACGICSGSFITIRGETIMSGNGEIDRAEARLDGRNPIITFQGAKADNLKLKCHARAMRVNGYRISASCLNGMASIRIVGMIAGR